MGSYTIDYEGVEELFSDPAGPVAVILEHKCLMVEGVMKTLLLTPGSGRLYTQHVYTKIKGAPPGTPGRLGFWGSRPPHQASAPGEPPASDYGQLLASIGHSLVEDGGVITGRVYAEKAYALY